MAVTFQRPAHATLVCNIRAALQEQRIRGYQFADAVGVDKSLVSRWLSQSILIGIDHLDRISAALGVDVPTLFEEPKRTAAQKVRKKKQPLRRVGLT